MGRASCRTVRERWTARLELDPALVAKDEHVQACASCSAWLGDMRTLADGIERRGRGVLGAEASGRVLRRLQPVIDDVVERRQAPQRAWSFRLAWAAAALLVVAGAALFWARRPEPPGAPELAQIVFRAGEVELLGSRDVGDQGVGAGQRLRTGPGGEIALKSRGDIVYLEPESELVLRELTQAVSLELVRGAVLVDATPAAGRRPLAVTASFGTVRVLGTSFRVSTADGGSVATVRGKVEVAPAQPDAAPQLVPAGRRFSAKSAAQEPLPTDEHDAIERRLATAKGEAPKPAAEVVPAPTGDKLEPPRPTAKRAAPRGAPPTVTEALAASDCQRARSELARHREAGKDERAELLAMVAECHLARGEAARALGLYEELAAGGTGAAPNAQFEVGRVSETLGDRKGAERAFERYVARYPRGPLAAEARFRLCSLAVEAKRFGQAASCLERYRTEYRRGGRRAEGLFLEATLYKDALGDPGRAARLFGEYLERDEGAERESAAYWRAACLKQLADPGFEAAARRYLELFPAGGHAGEVSRWLGR